MSIMNKIGEYLVKNAPSILSGIGVAGVVSTAFLASKATLAAKDVLETADDPVEGFFTTVKTVWPVYIPTILVGSATVCCILAANSINTKRNLVLAGLYSVAEKTLSEYQDEIIEEVGALKETKIRDRIAQKKLDEDPVSDGPVIVTERGNTLCYDAWTGRYFLSDVEKVRQDVNTLNKQIIHDNYASLNDWFDLIGLGNTGNGDAVGWNTDKLLELDITGGVADDGQPCLVITYRPAPSPWYFRVN